MGARGLLIRQDLSASELRRLARRERDPAASCHRSCNSPRKWALKIP
jgi:hypothetical protein